jgi:hypothetical protein
VGFSDPLWTLLIQTWLEEHESSSSTRPNIAVILEQLQDEARAWSPTSRLFAPPILMERKASCVFCSLRTRLCVTHPKTTATSSIEPSGFSDQLMGLSGVFPPLCLRNMDSPQFSGDGLEYAAPRGEFGSEFNNLLKGIGGLIGPEQHNDHSDDPEISTWDEQASSNVSPIVRLREARKSGVQPPATLTSTRLLPPSPPRRPSATCQLQCHSASAY